MTATAAAARYLPDGGTLELTGSEPGSPAPHVVNDQIRSTPASMDVTLDGPDRQGRRSAKSVSSRRKRGCRPEGRRVGGSHAVDAEAGPAGQCDRATPRLRRQSSRSATYTGNAQLWQGETRHQGAVARDRQQERESRRHGSVATVTILQQEGKDGDEGDACDRSQRPTSFTYEDNERRATYTGDAHLSGPQGDLTAGGSSCFLKPSGDELERVEAFEEVTLRVGHRRRRPASA